MCPLLYTNTRYFVNGHFNSLVSPVIDFHGSYTGNIPGNANNIRVTIFNYEKVPPAVICIKNYLNAQKVDISVQGTPQHPKCVQLSSDYYNCSTNTINCNCCCKCFK
ncbi:hypothetical protein ADU88_12455 [Clostridium botulinum]|nr:hypothetical protein ADU88_12455 [Clostridium botulinum]